MKTSSRFLIALWASLLAVACASIGNPDGGRYDEEPPVVVSCMPADRAVGVTKKKVSILFNEYVKLESANEKVVISPPQIETANVRAEGKRVKVDLFDSLQANTTYTIDFSDAISDNNENNPLGNYTFTFSTGERIDTFEVAGTVLDASNLEPIKGIQVGLYADLADSAFRTKPLLRVARTDGRGRFVIKGVAPGEYRVYALQDADGNYMFNQKSEMVAFSHTTYKPSAGPDIRQDTIWRDSLRIDNILRVPYTHFYPDDIILLAFQEVQTDRYLLKQPERKDADRFTLYFSYGNPQLPEIRGFNFDEKDAFVLEASEKKDTLTYWLRDTALVNQDTLSMQLSYLMTDSTGVLVTQIDTVDVIAKTSYAKRQKDLKKQVESWEKEQAKLKKQGEPYDSIMPREPLKVQYNVPGTMAPDSRPTINMPAPLARCDTASIHLYTKVDTLWYRVPVDVQRRDSLLRTYDVLAEWTAGSEYSLEVDSAAFEDIYGNVSKPFKQGIKISTLDEFSTIVLQLAGVTDTTYVVELLDQSEKTIKQVRTEANGDAVFFYVKPGGYYARAFRDRNGNGVWDTGNYDANLQPEEVYYFPGRIDCKEKWDITRPWNFTATPLNMQKPGEITKQKPDKEKQKLLNRNAERARRLGISYYKNGVLQTANNNSK